MIIGGGEAGRSLITEIQNSKYLDQKVVCIIDDDPYKIGRYIKGVKVVGNRNSIKKSVKKYNVQQIILTIPSANAAKIRPIVEICQDTNCELNGIRQFIAAAGIFACTTLMLKKKYFPVVLIILALSTIHGSALIMLPIVFVAQGKAWNKKTVLLIIAIVLATAFVGQFTPILDTLMAETQYSDILTNEIWLNDDGTNIIRVIVYSVPALLSLVGKKFIDNENNPVVNLSVNMSICAAAFYLLSSVTSGIYVGRIPIYMSLYSYISLPWLLKNIFTDKSMKIMYVFTIVLYLLFFYYQMFVIW